MRPRRVCVFCGSSLGARAEFAAAARTVGRLLVARGLGVVYGGGRVGLMGSLADAVLEAGGEAIGVIPEQLADRELAHRGLTELHVVGSMHERKARMFDLADAFAALPGGLGTLEEMFEMATWAQLGLHPNPVALLNAAGYFDPLVAFLDSAVREGLLAPEHRSLVHVERDAERLVDVVATWASRIPRSP